MSTISTLRRTALALAIAVVASPWPAAGAFAQTHDHASAVPSKLALDHGRKWTTDAPLRAGMGRIRTLVAPQVAPAHTGKLSPAQYAELSGRIEAEVGTIVANCKLEPNADAMLHLVLADIGAGTDAMAGKTAGLSPQQGLVKVALAVNDYQRHFADPGLQPIRNLH